MLQLTHTYNVGKISDFKTGYVYVVTLSSLSQLVSAYQFKVQAI